MTKVQAIRKVIEDNGGSADVATIYNEITKYHRKAKESEHWQEEIRYVIYREIHNNKTFRHVGYGLFGLI